MSSLSSLLRVAGAFSLMMLSLGLSSCRRPQESSVANEAAFPQSTNVGPIPGDVTVVHQNLDPYLKDVVAIQEGHRLFAWYNCSGCHGVHGGGGMGPSLRDETWMYGNSDAQIMDTLIHGRSKGMPAWGNKIPEDQLWKVIAYIKSMNTPLEPDAPRMPAEEVIPSGDFYKPSAPTALNTPPKLSH
jgi:cytochrome c oxidase cbb3-type subunit 3